MVASAIFRFLMINFLSLSWPSVLSLAVVTLTKSAGRSPVYCAKCGWLLCRKCGNLYAKDDTNLHRRPRSRESRRVWKTLGGGCAGNPCGHHGRAVRADSDKVSVSLFTQHKSVEREVVVKVISHDLPRRR